MEIYRYDDPTTAIHVDDGATTEVEARQLERRRKLAELLMQQSVNGGPVYSNKAGIARVLGGIFAGMDNREIDAKERELAKRSDADRTAQYDKLARVLMMKPAVGPGLPQVDDAGYQMPGNVAQTSDARMAGAADLLRSRDPLVAKAAMGILSERPEKPAAYTLKPGESRYEGNRLIASQPKEPEKEPDAIRAMKSAMKAAGVDPDSPEGRQAFEAWLKKQTTHQPGATVNVDNKAPSAFWKKFGEDQAEAFAKEQEQARGASQMLQSIGTARDLLSKGIYSGAAADWRLTAGKALKQAGFNINQDDIANTEAFASTMGNQVLAGIKQLGAGSAISNADREFMEKVVGGKITLDPKGIERILGISEQMARSRINAFNKKAKAMQRQAPADFMPYPLEIEDPGARPKTRDGRTVDDILNIYR